MPVKIPQEIVDGSLEGLYKQISVPMVLEKLKVACKNNSAIITFLTGIGSNENI
jgi:hypothetical protein